MKTTRRGKLERLRRQSSLGASDKSRLILSVSLSPSTPCWRPPKNQVVCQPFRTSDFARDETLAVQWLDPRWEPPSHRKIPATSGNENYTRIHTDIVSRHRVHDLPVNICMNLSPCQWCKQVALKLSPCNEPANKTL